VPFVCGARDLGEALRRIAEGAAMIRSKGEAGSGNIVEAVRHMRAIRDMIAQLSVLPREELVARARDLGAPLELVRERRGGEEAARRAVLRGRRLDAGRCRADDGARRRRASSSAAGSSSRPIPAAFARAIVDATTHWQDADVVLRAHSRSRKTPRRWRDSTSAARRAPSELLASRGETERAGAHGGRPRAAG
jgi:pyridoxal 5'-phosphate synthase pdxS subunit